MNANQICLLLLYAIGMAVGQLLFKMASIAYLGRVKGIGGLNAALSIGTDPYFLAALSLYLLLSVFWIWILTFVPLSLAYPFVAIAFLLVPICGVLFFNETISMRGYLGMLMIAVGVALLSGQSE